MKPKVIKSILASKFKKWVESIEDPRVKELVERNTIITGGSITSLLMGERPKDFDVYFRNKETTKAVAQYYVGQWNQLHGAVKNKLGNSEFLFVLDGQDVQDWKDGKVRLPSIAPNYLEDRRYYPEITGVSHMITNTPPDRIKIIYPSDGVIQEEGHVPTRNEMTDALDDLSEIMDPPDAPEEEKPKPKFRPVFMTTNAITLSDEMQLIIRFYGEPDQIHSNYDFEHCCCYWDSTSQELVTPEKALMCILNKDLFYRGSKYPLCSIIRARKFINRGWKINAGQYLKMCFQVAELDLHDIDVLEDQLVGVDTVYFIQVVASLRAMRDKDPSFSFDSTYMAAIVDRIF